MRLEIVGSKTTENRMVIYLQVVANKRTSRRSVAGDQPAVLRANSAVQALGSQGTGSLGLQEIARFR